MADFTLSPEDIAAYKEAGGDNTASVLSKDDIASYNNEKLNATIAQRSAGRQWLGQTIAQQNQTQPQGLGQLAGRGLTNALNIASMPGQLAEDVVSRGIDSVTGGKVASQLPPGSPMEYGDVANRFGASEPLAQTVGFLGSLATPSPVQGLGRIAGAVSGGILSGGKKALTAVIKGPGASLMNKNPRAVQEMFKNPSMVFNKANTKFAEDTAMQIANEIPGEISKVKQTAKGLYQSAAKGAGDNAVNPQMGSSTAQSMRDHLAQEFDQDHIDTILNKPAWKEPANANSYTQTHSYIPPQESGLVDEHGHALMNPSQQEIRGSVVSKSGPNTTKETQITGVRPDGSQYTKGVQQVQSTSDKNPLQSVTVGDALSRMEQGLPVSVKQVAGLKSALDSIKSTTAGNMSDEALNLLGAHSNDFAKANTAWKDYKTLANQNLFAADNRGGAVPGEYGNKILNYFNHPNGSQEFQAPNILDQTIAKYGGQSNYADRIRAVSAGAGMNSFKPHGAFAAAGLASSVGGPAVEHIPGLNVLAEHPVAKAVAGISGAGMLALSMKGLNKGLIRALTIQRILPAGADRLLKSPAGQYLANSLLGSPAMAAIKGQEQAPQNSDEESAQ